MNTTHVTKLAANDPKFAVKVEKYGMAIALQSEQASKRIAKLAARKPKFL